MAVQHRKTSSLQVLVVLACHPNAGLLYSGRVFLRTTCLSIETNDLAAELTLDAKAELCAEYIEQYHTGAFYEDSWWKWFAEDGTIGITVNPDALQSGGNRTRTLEEFIHESDTIE